FDVLSAPGQVHRPSSAPYLQGGLLRLAQRGIAIAGFPQATGWADADAHHRPGPSTRPHGLRPQHPAAGGPGKSVALVGAGALDRLGPASPVAAGTGSYTRWRVPSLGT